MVARRYVPARAEGRGRVAQANSALASLPYPPGKYSAPISDFRSYLCSPAVRLGVEDLPAELCRMGAILHMLKGAFKVRSRSDQTLDQPAIGGLRRLFGGSQ